MIKSRFHHFLFANWYFTSRNSVRRLNVPLVCGIYPILRENVPEETMYGYFENKKKPVNQ